MPQKRRNPPARYQLPTVVHPSSHKCFVIQVPNDIYHIAAFRGQLEALARAYTWGNDDAHTALDVASVWRTVIDNMESCMPALQFRQPNNCTLEVSFDGGFTWSSIFNSYNCSLDAIAAEIANGTLQAGGVAQPPAGGVVPVNECHTFHVVLQANQRWHSPVPVSDGYSITIANVKGGWSDGYALGAVWQCPDGEYYSLGYCTGSFISGYPGDPIPSLYHMRLIGNAGAYFDAYNTTYIVPNGTGTVDLQFQANDSDISDNQGSIEFDVAICNYSEWCYSFDFTTGDHGWLNQYSDSSEYIAGQGFRMFYDGSNGQSCIYRLMSSTVLTGFKTYWTALTGFPDQYNRYRAGNGGTVIDSNWLAGSPHAWTGSRAGTTEANLINVSFSAHYSVLVTKIELRGTGVNPFGSSNC